MQAARIARTQQISTQNIRASAAERALMDEARGNGLYGQLRDSASNDLALGRSLSAEQERDAIQSARAGAAARGLGVGNSALAAEMLNRDRFATQRENERRAFAGNVLNQGTGLQQAANQAYASRMEGNRARELQAGLANQSVDANRAIQQAQLRQQANLTTNQNEQQRVLADAGYAQQAGLSNQDFGFRAASQDAQLAQQAALANQSAGLQLGQTNAQLAQQAALANQQTQANRFQFNAANQQQMSLANQDAALRASLANQQAGLTLGQSNAQLLQQARLANQSTGLQAQQLNQAANARAAEFQQQGGLQASLANQQTAFNTGQFNAANEQQASLQNAQLRQQAALANQSAFNQLSQYNAGLQQQANAASFESAQQRAMADAGYQQQAALSNQDANLRAAQYNVGQDMAAQQANQQANQTQEQYNRAFLGQVAGMNFDQNQARTSMLSGLYGQQAGLGQTTASLQQGMAQSQVALDPYQRALGSNMPIATIGPSAGMIGQAYGQTMGYGQDLFNTNLNAQASMYNSWGNNNAMVRAARYGGGNNTAAIWGAVAQGVGSAIGQYASCWVARAAWGENNPRWVEFRESMFAYAPEWFVRFYITHGPAIAQHINTPLRRAITRSILTTLQNLWTPKSQLQPA